MFIIINLNATQANLSLIPPLVFFFLCDCVIFFRLLKCLAALHWFLKKTFYAYLQVH